MLNSTKRDRIFSSMQFSKASSFASIASSDVIVYASRSVILRGRQQIDGSAAWWATVEATSKAIMGIAWKVELAEMATGEQERDSDTR
ncbi:hypothetical protein BHE74_00006028 [Ensete ventricosum]|nr:hypothetical protein BHE74_00006028 [Ensete ventricosum]